MRKGTRRVGAVVAAFALVAVTAATAFAVTITAPASNPFTTTRTNAAGDPDFFTVSASGFTAGDPVYIQQCDGVNPSVAGYSLNDHCDFASGNTPLNADGSGNASFLAT